MTKVRLSLFPSNGSRRTVSTWWSNIVQHITTFTDEELKEALEALNKRNVV